MTQGEWARELALELTEGGIRVGTLELLDALGSCGLELCPGDGAASAFWETVCNEVSGA